jgi:phage FluMu gp28-like protein
VLKAPFLLELRNVPFEQQKQILFYVVDRLPRFTNGKHDARGNGQYLAEVAQQKYGELRIEQVMLSQPWYLENMPVMKAAFEDRLIELPMDADVKGDLRLITTVRGIAMVPNDAHTRGSDGGQRHGDAAVAVCLAIAAAKADAIEYGYRPVAGVPRDDGRLRDLPNHDDDYGRRDEYRSPLGAGLRGSI